MPASLEVLIIIFFKIVNLIARFVRIKMLMIIMLPFLYGIVKTRAGALCALQVFGTDDFVFGV